MLNHQQIGKNQKIYNHGEIQDLPDIRPDIYKIRGGGNHAEYRKQIVYTADYEEKNKENPAR